MRHLCTAGLLLSALAASGLASAQAPIKLKAGLWEHGFQMASQSGQIEAAMKQAQAEMAKLPPDQRKMMEQMMAQRGMSLDASGQRVRICLTPEDVARDTPPPAQDGCTQTATRSGNTWTMSFQCPARNGQPASNGQGTMTVQSPTAYGGQFNINTQVQQKTEQVRMTTSGLWVSADCGAVKPVGR